MAKIRFRPHHFLCANGFKGRGYSPSFIRNFAAIMKILRGPNGDESLIEVTEHVDDICIPCPHRRDKSCVKQDFITALDQRHIAALHLQGGQVLSWKEAKTRLVQYVDDATFDMICNGCVWKAQGICLSALKQLRQNQSPAP